MTNLVRRPTQFRDFALAIKDAVDRELGQWLAPRVARATKLGRSSAAVTDAIAQFATRGGKRVRAVLLAAAYEGYAPTVAGAPPPSALDILPALLSVELLHAYLLMHDDWMDEDEVRRGGPTVHAMLRDHFGSLRRGEIGAILAGDLTASYALEALVETRTSPDRLAESLKEFARIEVDVVLGQTLDVYQDEDVDAVHDLKTNSYTVRGPLLLGAILAGASPMQRAELEAFAWPLGIAFQLRDDLLGTFGDPKKTGKSSANDLRQGKRTALVHELLAGDSHRDAESKSEDRAIIERVLGVADASADDVARVVDRFISSGAKLRVEERLRTLLEDAHARLAKMDLEPNARTILAGAVSALGEREQ
ncbi:polyprenyl synthetase family protein [Pendulispora albinea]|uniref:Polyprenyl synthetase family protein n=1 Tax=Pendulispora albinea TaxID=2741071 RepID=A0ABZ2MBQ1_9BACT